MHDTYCILQEKIFTTKILNRILGVLYDQTIKAYTILGVLKLPDQTSGKGGYVKTSKGIITNGPILLSFLSILTVYVFREWF